MPSYTPAQVGEWFLLVFCTIGKVARGVPCLRVFVNCRVKMSIGYMIRDKCSRRYDLVIHSRKNLFVSGIFAESCALELQSDRFSETQLYGGER